MGAVEKFLAGIIGVAMITTLVLPKRQTAAVFTAGGNAVSKIVGTSIGTK